MQLLWYRKDLVPKPPETWDEMIAMAKKLPAGEGNILEQGKKYEGYVVWFNNLVASAGGDDRQRRRATRRSTRRRSRPRRSSRTSPPPAARTRRCRPTQEDQARLAFEAGKGAFLLNWPYVYAAARADAEDQPDVTKKVFENMGYARWPGVNKGEPSKVSIGGANLGIPKTGQHPELATQAALCMTSASGRRQEAINEGLPPVMNATYDDAEGPQGLPVRRPAARAAQGLGGAPADAVVLRRDAGDPGHAASAGRASTRRRRSTRCKDRLNILADGGMY